MLSFIGHLLQLIISPNKGWEDISSRGDDPNNLTRQGLYPLLGIAACSVFARLIFIDLTITSLVQQALIEFIRFFLTYFIASFVMSLTLIKVVDGKPNEKKYCTFIIYNIGILTIISIINNCLPFELSLIQFLPLLVVITMWTGARYISVNKDKLVQFTAISILSILIPPYLLHYLFNFIL